MKAMKHSATHKDHYKYHAASQRWVRVKCVIHAGGICTAPRTLPRGIRFNATSNLGHDERVDTELRFEEYVVNWKEDSNEAGNS